MNPLTAQQRRDAQRAAVRNRARTAHAAVMAGYATQQAARVVAGTAVTTGLARSTARTYRSSWRAFTAWCVDEKVSSLPAVPVTVERFLLARSASGLGRATIVRDVAAIRLEHQRAGAVDPTVDPLVVLTVRSARRKPGVGVASTTRPLTTAEVLEILARIERGDLRNTRDAAIILLGWATAATTTDLAGLRDDDVTPCDVGLRLRLCDRTVVVHRGSRPRTDPVAALQAWILASGGVTFRGIGRYGKPFGEHVTGSTLSGVVTQRAADAGLHGVSGKSLRAGAEQVLADAGVPADQLAQFMHRTNALAHVERPDDVAPTWSATALLGL